MSRYIYRHKSTSKVVIGTVGMPGERQFFLQVSSDIGLTCVAIEKTQAMALSERLRIMIRELRRNQLASLDELNLPMGAEEGSLEFPITEDFRAGVIGISWSQEEQRILVEVQAIGDESVSELLTDEEAILIEDAPDLLAFTLRISQARSLCDRTDLVVAAGRQPCPFCGLPVNPEGHLCPRANGYRR